MRTDYLPFGVASISGSETLDARFPGQWFQLEAGLHYNWHRHYDPTLGRYTQPDPLGFVDGPSVYAYGNNSSIQHVDRDGQQIAVPLPPLLWPLVPPAIYCSIYPDKCSKLLQQCYRTFGGGGGGGDGSEKKDRDLCQEQLDDDNDCCRSLNVRRHTAICGAQAMQRYASCIAKTQIPTLGYCRR